MLGLSLVLLFLLILFYADPVSHPYFVGIEGRYQDLSEDWDEGLLVPGHGGVVKAYTPGYYVRVRSG